MARKFDKYGYNRQYKRKPASKRNPFPHSLPFIDDFSKHASNARAAMQPIPKKQAGVSRSQVEKAWQVRRNATRAMRQAHPGGGLDREGKYKSMSRWSEGEKKALVGAVAAPFVAATGLWYVEDPDLWARASILHSIKNDIYTFSKWGAKASGYYYGGKEFVRAFKKRDVRAMRRMARRRF